MSSNQEEQDPRKTVQGTSENVTPVASSALNPNNIKKKKQKGNKIKENCLSSLTNEEITGESGFSGQLYEIVLLMFLIFESYRKRQMATKGFAFHLATNVKKGFKFDDVIYMSSDKDEDGKDKSQIIFLQAKHKSSTAKLITSKTLLSSGDKGDFSLKKYFTSFLQTKKVFTENNDQHPVFSSEFDNCRFIIYTNALLEIQETKMPVKLENNNFTLHFLNSDNALYLEEHKEFYKLNINAIYEKAVNVLSSELKDAPEIVDLEVNDFLAKLELRTGQPTEEGLSKIIKKMIQAANTSMKQEDVSFVFVRMKTKVEQWWKEMEISTFLNESNTIYQDSMIIDIRFNVREPSVLFTGRTSELVEVHQSLQRKTQRLQVTCVSGLGGIGKTEFTKQYVKEYESCYAGNILWINAESEQTCAESFRRLAKQKLGIRTTTIDEKEKDIKVLKDEVYSFFFSRLRKSFFVFDNVEKSDVLVKFLPLLTPNQIDSAFKPHILLTSRLQEWEGVEGIDMFSLSELKVEEAVQFVKKGLNILEDVETIETEALVKKLQYYPLAIQQAISYIIYQKETELYQITNYIEEFELKKEELLNAKHHAGINNAYAQTTFTTWTLTVDKIKKIKDIGQLAINILNVIAYFAPDNIKRDLFLDISSSEREVKNAVRLLFKYSMINGEQKQGIFFIHRLVQEVTRIELKQHGQEEITVKSALQILNKKTLGTENVDHAVSSWAFASKYRELVREFRKLPHQVVLILHNCIRLPEAYLFGEKALESLESFQQEDEYLEDILNLKENVAGVLNTQGKYKEAHNKYRSIFEKFTTLFGYNDRRTLQVRSNIAQTLEKLGKYPEAYNEFKETLASQIFALGEDDEDTLLSKHNIAGISGVLGKYKEALLIYADLPTFGLQELNNYAVILDRLGEYDSAIQNYQNIVERKIKAFGDKHLSTMTTKHNLAGLLGIRGEFDKAFEMLNEVLEGRKDCLGPKHRDTCATENSMAMLLADQGKYVEALHIYEEVLSKMSISLGSDHPDSLTTRNNKGVALEKLGRYDEALDVYHYVLDQRFHLLGKEHPDTLITRNNVAVITECKGQHEEALKEHKEIYDLKKKTLGKNHLSTLTSQNNLAGVLESLQRYDEALKEYEYVLRRRTEKLGPCDLETLTTKNNLASVHLHLEQYKKAVPALREVLKEQSKRLCLNHRDLLATRINIAKGLAGQGNYSEALAALKEVLSILTTDSTEHDKHPLMLITKQNIAGVLKSMGKIDDALELYEEVFTKRMATIGASHPDTISTLKCLYDILEDGCKHKVALHSYQKILNIQINMPGGSVQNMAALQTKNSIAKLLKSQKNYVEALQTFQEILVGLRNNLDFDHEICLQVRHNIGTVQEQLGNTAEALKTYREVLAKRIECLGLTNDDTIATKSCLDALLDKMQ